MAARAPCTGQELIEFEAFSCLKQNISQFILEERVHLRLLLWGDMN